MNREEAVIGQKVTITKDVNHVWAGDGIIYDISHPSIALVELITGGKAGHRGGFYFNCLQPTARMKILKIRRSTKDIGLKVYGKVLGESGTTYNFGYIRRGGFRGWICSCEDFFFNRVGKNQNCKHLHFVRGQVGRYAATVKAEN